MATNFDPRVVGPGSVGEAKAPSVPWTGDGPFFDIAAAEGGAHVGANVVDSEEFASLAKDRDQFVADLDGTAFAFKDLIDAAHGLKVGHVLSLAKPAWNPTQFSVMILTDDRHLYT